MKPHLVVEQRITPLANKYSIYQANPDGGKANLIALAQQKRLAFKEQVNFYTDESKSQLAFSFRAEKAMDIHGRFFVEDASGNKIGAFRKDFKQSLITSTWHILDEQDKPTLTISESSKALAIIRRFVSFIPIIGEFIDLIVALFKYHFVIKNTDGEEIGQYKKTTLLRDNYELLMDDASYQSQDWRVLAAMAVALDALQGR